MLISLKSAIKIQYDFAEIDDPVDPDKTGYGVVICVFEPNSNKMARDQLFVASYSALAEKAPWPNYILIPEWKEDARQWMEVGWFYSPIDFLNIFTYVLFCIMTAVYFIFCLFGSCLCYLTVISKKSQKRTLRNFVDMWLLFPYALIPAIMHGLSFGVTFLKFAMELLYEWLKESGLLDGEGGLQHIFDSWVVHHDIVSLAVAAL
ncbi:hypothetical protein NECAME_07845 [Necator americanus]|uniref:Uncharacterized protein n=1 Tax=Necator americanus TaxID=51031 RepID=W2TM61_NECAM|nr:hypothetical protein NECAME_07845 [Necator americanus]ETN82734.1 hypothetical protein NECAME_07845 [Necator americanus]